MAAVGRCGLKYASTELKADRKFVMAAVAQNGLALKHVSAKLQADRKVVLAAIPSSMVWCGSVSTSVLESDPPKVDQRAFEQEGLENYVIYVDYLLEYVSEELKADREIMLAAA
eukprot:SAG25_NODE_8684_length_409_cov_0.838710_1_plen_113_part_01